MPLTPRSKVTKEHQHDRRASVLTIFRGIWHCRTASLLSQAMAAPVHKSREETGKIETGPIKSQECHSARGPLGTSPSLGSVHTGWLIAALGQWCGLSHREPLGPSPEHLPLWARHQVPGTHKSENNSCPQGSLLSRVNRPINSYFLQKLNNTKRNTGNI